MFSFYSEIDILLHLSNYEGLPLTILEAHSCLVYPIATDVGALKEICSDENSTLVNLNTLYPEKIISILKKIEIDRTILIEFLNTQQFSPYAWVKNSNKILKKYLKSHAFSCHSST